MRDEVLDSYDQGYKECLEDVDNYLVRMRIEDPEMREKVMGHIATRKARFQQTHAARKVKRCGGSLSSRARQRAAEVQRRPDVQPLSPYQHTHSPADSTTPEDHGGFDEEMGHDDCGRVDLVDAVNVDSLEEMAVEVGPAVLRRADGDVEMKQGRCCRWDSQDGEPRLCEGEDGKDAQNDSNNNRHSCCHHKSSQRSSRIISRTDNSSNKLSNSSSSNMLSNSSGSNSSSNMLSSSNSSSNMLSNSSSSNSSNTSSSYNKFFINPNKTPSLIIITNRQASTITQNSNDLYDVASLTRRSPFTNNSLITDPAELHHISRNTHKTILETRNPGDARGGHDHPGRPSVKPDSHWVKKNPSSSIPVSQQLSILIPAGVISGAGLPLPQQSRRQATITGSDVKAHAQTHAVPMKPLPVLLQAASGKPEHASPRGDSCSLLVTHLTQPLNTRLHAHQACSPSVTGLFPETERGNGQACDLSVKRESTDAAMPAEGRGGKGSERTDETRGTCLPSTGAGRSQQHGENHSDVWRPW